MFRDSVGTGKNTRVFSERSNISRDAFRVKPILAARCYACHSALRKKSGLRLDTAAELLLSLLPASAVSTMSDTQEMSEMDLLKRTEDREPVLNKPLALPLALSEANGEAKELRAERPILSPQPSALSPQ